jgi:hypothetical protein
VIDERSPVISRGLERESGDECEVVGLSDRDLRPGLGPRGEESDVRVGPGLDVRDIPGITPGGLDGVERRGEVRVAGVDPSNQDLVDAVILSEDSARPSIDVRGRGRGEAGGDQLRVVTV